MLHKGDYVKHINRKTPCFQGKNIIDNLLLKNNDLIKKCDDLQLNNTELIKKCDDLELNNKELYKKIVDLEISLKEVKLKSVKKKARLVDSNTKKVNSENVTTLTGNTFNNTFNVFQKPVNFGDQDDSFIDDKMTRKILNKGFDAIQEYVKTVHFNKNKPEYHNVYLPNMRDRNNVLVYKDDKWVLCEKNEIINEMKDNGIDFIQKKYDELDENNENDAKAIAKLKKFLQKYNNNGNVPYLDKDLTLILYNNRDMIPKKVLKDK